jgi:aminoglycoside phosphotransferase (APT) family kinase protein/putative sterol carrier protein
MVQDLSEMQARLTAWIQTKMPKARNLSVSDLEKPGMGLSSETYLFNMSWKEARKSKTMGVVLRAAPRGRTAHPKYDLGLQFHIMETLRDNTDVPVAEMLWLEESPSVIGVPFFLMKKLEGDVPQDYPSYHGTGMYFDATPQMRRKMWWGSLEAMVKVHKADWKRLGLGIVGAPGPGTDPVDQQLAYWERYLNWTKDRPEETYPTIEATLGWLKANRYAPVHVTFCWGDARIGNTLYSRPDRNVLAVMDWEMAFIGDPESDLAWFFVLDKALSKGYGLPPLEGTPTQEDIVRRYEELMGWKVKNLFYNEVMATFRYGLTLIASMKKMRDRGIPIPDEMLLNNFGTQHLSKLLGLPSPGPDPYAEEKVDINQLTVTVQFHFTGPSGYDWYLLSDKGNVSRHLGCVENPNCTIKVSTEDWRAIQSGQLNRLEAWSTGRFVTEGDHGLLSLLEDAIAKYSSEE